MRRGALAEHHVLGDLLAHHRHRLDCDPRAVGEPAAAPARRRGWPRRRGRPPERAGRAAPPSMKPGCRASSRGRRCRCRRIRAMSTLCSLAICRTSGDERCRSAATVRLRAAAVRRRRRGAAGAGAGCARRAARRRRCAARRRPCRRRGAVGAAQATQPRRRASPRLRRPAPITATTLLTGTVSPSFTRISEQRRRRPATGSPRPPCRSRSRTAARRDRPCRRPS